MSRYLQDITTGYGVVLAETTEANANPAEKLVTAYVYGLERISGLTKGTIGGAADTRTLRSEYVYDARGSVAQSVEKSNNVEILTQSNSEISSLIDIHSFSYTPFGELSGAKSSGYRFNGEEYDAATGMLNLRVRQYEPAMMRFSQMDLVRGEVVKPITLNRYAYCYDEPVGFVDPSGMRPPESGTYVGDDKYYDENGNLKGSNSVTAKPTATPKATAKPTATPKPTAQATATPSPTSSSNNNNSSGSSNSNSRNSIWDNVVNTAKNVVNTVVTAVKKVVKKVQGVISDAIEDFVSQKNIADLINQLSNSQLSDHQRVVIMNAIVEQQNLQNANASVSMRQAAFNKVCAEVAQNSPEMNMSVQDLRFMRDMEEQYGFEAQEIRMMLKIRKAIDAKYSRLSQVERDAFYALLMGGLQYGGFQWEVTTGRNEVSDVESILTQKLSLTDDEYITIKTAIRNQHVDAGQKKYQVQIMLILA